MSRVYTLLTDTQPATPSDSHTGREKCQHGNSRNRPDAPDVADAEVWPWDESLEPYGTTPWVLPGKGERGAGCGVWQPRAACPECGDVEFGPCRCRTRGCPNSWDGGSCAGRWQEDAAVKVTARIQAFRLTQPADRRRQVARAVVSPPEGEVMNERQMAQGRKKAAEIAEGKGWRGVTVVPHPWRPTREARREFERETGVPYSDGGTRFWRWLKDREDWRDLLFWSPHFEIIGVTGEDMDPATEDDDWLYSFEGSFGPLSGVSDRESHAEVYRHVEYLLSHTGWPRGSGSPAYAYYGSLSTAKFVNRATKGWQVEKPSAGRMEALERHVREAADARRESDEEDGGVSGEFGLPEGVAAVGRCDCGGPQIQLFDVGRYVRDVEPPPEIARRMYLARDWLYGTDRPPPGLRRPRSENEAAEAFEAMVNAPCRRLSSSNPLAGRAHRTYVTSTAPSSSPK